MSSLIQSDNFQDIIRVLNTSLNGKQKVPFALRAIPGIGRRFAILMCRKADVDLHKR